MTCPSPCPGSVFGPMCCEVCKECNSTEMIGANVDFERTRRITGYLVGTVERWNNAKRAEEKDRVRHGLAKKEAEND